MTETLVMIANTFGPIAGVLAYFLIKDWRDSQNRKKQEDQAAKRDKEMDAERTRRESDLAKRLRDIEDFQRQSMVTMLTNTTQVITENSAVIRQFVDALRTHPCLAIDQSFVAQLKGRRATKLKATGTDNEG